VINFISTFPPIVCGVADYTRYLVSRMPLETWKVTSFDTGISSASHDIPSWRSQVSYQLSLTAPRLPFPLRGEVAWFQHTFGIWGKDPVHFVRLLEHARKKGKKVVATFHTVHFQSGETGSGLCQTEEDLLAEALSSLDALTVCTVGAHRAVTTRFPQYQHRVVVLRHGVHTYSSLGQKTARERLLRHLIDAPDIPSRKRKDLERVYSHFFSPQTIVLGNFGFLAAGKSLSDLYRLRRLVQERLPSHPVLCLTVGSVRPGNDRKAQKYLLFLQELESQHDGKENFFFEHYLPEELLSSAFKALDFSVFWCGNATQSGRVSHAQGVGSCIVGRRVEGIGETLELSGLPVGETLEELAETIQRIVLHPELREGVLRSSRRYARRYSYEVQAEKHLLLAESLLRGQGLVPLDTPR